MSYRCCPCTTYLKKKNERTKMKGQKFFDWVFIQYIKKLKKLTKSAPSCHVGALLCVKK